MAKHRAVVYRSKEAYLASRVNTPRARRRALRAWKLHVEKHGNVPLVEQCPICSDAEQRGLHQRPCKVVRGEQRA